MRNKTEIILTLFIGLGLVSACAAPHAAPTPETPAPTRTPVPTASVIPPTRTSLPTQTRLPPTATPNPAVTLIEKDRNVYSASFSEDGQRIVYYAVSDNSDLEWFEYTRDTASIRGIDPPISSNQKIWTQIGVPEQWTAVYPGSRLVSPTQKWVIYQLKYNDPPFGKGSRTEVWLSNADGSARQKLANNWCCTIGDVLWQPDDQGAVIVGGYEGPESIAYIHIPTGKFEYLDLSTEEGGVFMSPDGAKLALISTQEYGYITIFDIATQQRIRIDRFQYTFYWQAAWSKDSRFLYYRTDENGIPEIRAYDRINATHQTVLEEEEIAQGFEGPASIGLSDDRTKLLMWGHYLLLIDLSKK